MHSTLKKVSDKPVKPVKEADETLSQEPSRRIAIPDLDSHGISGCASD